MPRSYLHDRVRVERLKIDAPESGPMRRVNEKGEMAQIVNGEWPPFRHLLLWTLDSPATGAMRGHHVHENRVERAYVVSGKVDVAVQPNDRAVPVVFVPLEAGERIVIDHGIAHAYRSRGPAIVLEMSEQPYDPLDVQPFEGLPK
jgi:mannose-6-phosphate isomerase-like protein (cupin superfamily)